ncbi:MAG: glycosyltransferase involved in cell wall biosynthesis [Saprospiraceae bacterium]|jgi:glycosyltransferase involved in cell wall biosynthesis
MIEKLSISVLLCTYNDEAFLAEAIQSILSQTFMDFEFIIINDGSTDETEAIIQSFSDERILYLKNTKNSGLEFSKNRGIEIAKGKYIAYLDGDDKSHEGRLQAQFDYMEANPEIGLCATAMQYFGKTSNFLYPPETDDLIRLEALSDTPLPHPTCMIRTAVLHKNKIRYRTDFNAAEDYPFMLDLLTKTQAYCLQKPLYYYRKHEGSITVIKKKIQDESARRAGRLAFQMLLRMEVTAGEWRAVKKLFCNNPEKKSLGLLAEIFERVEINEKDTESTANLKQLFKETGLQKIVDFQEANRITLFNFLRKIIETVKRIIASIQNVFHE